MSVTRQARAFENSPVVFVTAAEFQRTMRPALSATVSPSPTERGPRAARDNAIPRVKAVTVVEEEDERVTVYLPDVSPIAIRAAVDAAVVQGEMNKLAGKHVNVVNANPALVAAFVYAAKPWLRWFSVNNCPISPLPKK